MADVLRRRSGLLAALTAAWSGVASAPAAAVGPALERCTSSADAPVVKRDRARAKDRATEAALARCAEQIVASVLADGRAGSGLSPADRARAVSSLTPQLNKDPGRLFARTKLLSDRAEGGWVKVELEAEGRLDLLIPLARAAALGLSRGRAVVGVIVHESTQVRERSEIHGESLAGGQLARLLYDRGYELRPVRFVAAQEVGLLDDARALAARARESEVELLVAGEVVLINDERSPLDRTRSVAIEGRFQVVDNTGRVRGRVPMSTRLEAGTPLKALSRALAGGLLQQLFDGIQPLLAVDAARPSVEARVIALSFSGFDEFRAGARTVLELLKIIPGVSQIEEVDFYAGRLDAEIRWAGTLEALELELTTELSKHRGVSDLRVVKRGADRLELAR